MPDSEDTTVHAMQAPGPDAVVDCVLPDPDRMQLIRRDDPVLALGDSRDSRSSRLGPPTLTTRPSFAAIYAAFLGLDGHGGMMRADNARMAREACRDSVVAAPTGPR